MHIVATCVTTAIRAGMSRVVLEKGTGAVFIFVVTVIVRATMCAVVRSPCL